MRSTDMRTGRRVIVSEPAITWTGRVVSVHVFRADGSPSSHDSADVAVITSPTGFAWPAGLLQTVPAVWCEPDEPAVPVRRMFYNGAEYDVTYTSVPGSDVRVPAVCAWQGTMPTFEDVSGGVAGGFKLVFYGAGRAGAHHCGEPGDPVGVARCGDCWTRADEAFMLGSPGGHRG